MDGTLFDVMIYNYTNGFENASVTVADSARLFFTADKKYLVLRLYQGESFENLGQDDKKATGLAKNIPYRRETFSAKQLLLDFDSDFARYDESVLEDQHVSKNVVELIESIDSVKQEAHQRSMEQSSQLVETKYFGRERNNGQNIETTESAKANDKKEIVDVESLYAGFSVEQKKRVADLMQEHIDAYSNQIEYNSLLLDDAQRYVRRHEIELYRKFTLAFACLIFFFIGAPLGAIIRKGGLGAPVVISVVLFIIYYIIDNTGYKMAREAIWPCWMGMWLSSAVLLPIGIFLTYKAATDSALFNPEAWKIGWKRGVSNLKMVYAENIKKFKIR